VIEKLKGVRTARAIPQRPLTETVARTACTLRANMIRRHAAGPPAGASYDGAPVQVLIPVKDRTPHTNDRRPRAHGTDPALGSGGADRELASAHVRSPYVVVQRRERVDRYSTALRESGAAPPRVTGVTGKEFRTRLSSSRARERGRSETALAFAERGGRS